MVSSPSATDRRAPVTSRVLMHSAVTAVLFRGVNVVSGLVTLPLLLASLTQIDFGIWVVMSQAVSLLALSDLGAGNAIGRFVARSRGLEAHDEISEVLSTVLAILLAAAVGGGWLDRRPRVARSVVGGRRACASSFGGHGIPHRRSRPRVSVAASDGVRRHGRVSNCTERMSSARFSSPSSRSPAS